MKNILDQPEEEVPPLDPKKVFLFGVLLAMIVLAGWRFWRAQKAVAEVAEASKDYRKLFPARDLEAPPAPPPLPKPLVPAAAPASGIGMLKIDDDMRQQAPPSAEPPAVADAPVEAAAAPAPVKAAETAPAPKPAKREFVRPRLNAGAFSRLNGGAGLSGGSMGGGGTAAPAAPAVPAIPAAEKK
ncbi:MAG: hypothetical protein HYV14_12510 [Elusimicrobia bacterium]|nr:hypothetical protein [Elusimicrobiota bacterium]